MPRLPLLPSQLELERTHRAPMGTHTPTHTHKHVHTQVFVFSLCGPLHHQLIFPVENPTQIHNQTSLISIMFPLRQRSKQSDLTKEIKKAPAGIAMENQTHQTQALSFVFFLMSFKLGPNPLGHLANTRLPKFLSSHLLLPTGSSAGLLEPLPLQPVPLPPQRALFFQNFP